MKQKLGIRLRPLAAADLDSTNAVIEAAMMTWSLPKRLKRLSLSSYRYDPTDLEHLTLMGAWPCRPSSRRSSRMKSSDRLRARRVPMALVLLGRLSVDSTSTTLWKGLPVCRLRRSRVSVAMRFASGEFNL